MKIDPIVSVGPITFNNMGIPTATSNNAMLVTSSAVYVVVAGMPADVTDMRISINYHKPSEASSYVAFATTYVKSSALGNFAAIAGDFPWKDLGSIEPTGTQGATNHMLTGARTPEPGGVLVVRIIGGDITLDAPMEFVPVFGVPDANNPDKPAGGAKSLLTTLCPASIDALANKLNDKRFEFASLGATAKAFTIDTAAIAFSGSGRYVREVTVRFITAGTISVGEYDDATDPVGLTRPVISVPAGYVYTAKATTPSGWLLTNIKTTGEIHYSITVMQQSKATVEH